MNKIPTPHIEAQKEQIAKTVIMPGDPLRAKFIAENFLENVVCFNKVRNMLGYTGKYKGKEISVMGSGMGMASIGIYSYELFKFYDVENIIRIGTAGGISSEVEIMDVVIGMGACTDSNFALQYKLPGQFAPVANYDLLQTVVKTGETLGANVKVGNILSSDVFYGDDVESLKDWQKLGVLAVEMESASLYMNASRLNKKALCMVTVSDKPFTGESLTAEERQIGLENMIRIALESSLKL